MRAFDFVLLLFSFVFALALTHLLSRQGSLLLVRKRVRFSALQTLMVINAIVMVYEDWLTLWAVRVVREWDMASITIFFAFALSNYFFCSVAAPETSQEGIDLDAFYWENYRLFYGLIIVNLVIGFLAALVFLKSGGPAYSLSLDLEATLPWLMPTLLALTVSRRWAQWTSAIGLLLVSVWWLIAFKDFLS